MSETIGLPPNPIHEWIRIRDVYRAILAERGEDDPQLQCLREQGGQVLHPSRHFIEHNNGLLCLNTTTQKAIDFFERRASDLDTIPLHEPKVIELLHAAGGGKVLEQPLMMDLGVLISRQFVDIKRCVGSDKRVSPKLALLRGLASAKAVKFTPDMHQIKLGDIHHTQTRGLLISVDADLIEWLGNVGLDHVPTPAECCIYG